jgi:hypothetical protein
MFLETKKEGNTKGKMFFTCQKERRYQCGFFLWEDQAKVREKAALLNNSGTEPAVAPVTPRRNPFEPKPFRGMDSIPRGASSSSEEEEGSGDVDLPRTPSRSTRAETRSSWRNGSLSPPPSQRSELRKSEVRRVGSPATSVATAVAAVTKPSIGASSRKQVAFASSNGTQAAKRKRNAFEEEEDDDFDDLDSETERQLAYLAEQNGDSWHGLSQTQGEVLSQTQARSPIETPRAQRSHDSNGGGLPTPVSRNSLLLSSELREARRQKDDATPSSGTIGRSSDVLVADVPDTPTPMRTSDVPASSPSGKSLQDHDLAGEIMGLLEDQRVESSVRIAVRNAVDRYTLQVAGVLRGRDMTRSVLKSKDARVAELQDKVTQLETQMAADRRRIQNRQAKGLAIFQQDD